MKLFLISGAPDTGKSTTVYHICTFLLGRGYLKKDLPYGTFKHIYVPPTTYPPASSDDFACLLEKGGVKVMIHTATDDLFNINALITHVRTESPDIVITSCRDFGDWPRNYLCGQFGLTNAPVIGSIPGIDVEEFPLAKITRRGPRFASAYVGYFTHTTKLIERLLIAAPYHL